jgi:curved DNA-binding protein CbpA
MSTPDDLYRVLQVVPEADHEVIRAAYRALARKYHPDLAGGSKEQMAALNAAWGVLEHPRTRAMYDRKRLAKVSSENGRSAPSAPIPQPARQPDRVPPPAGKRPPNSTILDFGRYVDWSIEELARHDPDYLEWLIRTPNGRRFTRQIEAALARFAPPPPAPEPVTGRRKRRF